MHVQFIRSLNLNPMTRDVTVLAENWLINGKPVNQPYVAFSDRSFQNGTLTIHPEKGISLLIEEPGSKNV